MNDNKNYIEKIVLALIPNINNVLVQECFTSEIDFTFIYNNNFIYNLKIPHFKLMGLVKNRFDWDIVELQHVFNKPIKCGKIIAEINNSKSEVTIGLYLLDPDNDIRNLAKHEYNQRKKLQ
jgi:hypothetical protein